MSRVILLVLAVLALLVSVSGQLSSSSSSISAAPSSSSSSSSSYGSSSSSADYSSSSPSTGSPDAYPSGSIAVAFTVDFVAAVTASNYQSVAVSVQLDIAFNFANLTSANETLVAEYIVITHIGTYTLAPASRRLLQTGGTSVTFVILGNITNSVVAFSPTAAVMDFKSAAANGTLTAPNSGATIPPQNVTSSSVGSTPSSSSSSSTGYQNNGASSVVPISAAVLFSAVASLALLL